MTKRGITYTSCIPFSTEGTIWSVRNSEEFKGHDNSDLYDI